MRISLPASLLILPLLATGTVFAQEFAVTVGELSGTNPSAGGGGNLSLNAGVAVDASYSRKIRETGWGNLGWELTGIYGPIRYTGGTPAAATKDIYSIFAMPGLRMQFTPKEPLSPWISLNGGYAFYGASSTSIAGAPTVGGGNTSTGGAGFGVGMDFSNGKKYAFRGEVRGIYTGSPNFGVPTSGGQFNFVIGLGIVWRGAR